MEETTNATAQSESAGLATLSAGLARCLARENEDGNLVFSPLSIYAALALLAVGARGATKDEILRVLGVQSRRKLKKFVSRVAKDALMDQSGSGGPRVAFASGIWSDLTCPLKAAYRSTLVDKFKSEARDVDFINNPETARCQINAWAAKATSNLIDSIFGPGSITRITRVVLGSAIYFKGKWEKPFKKKYTTNELFYRLDGDNVHVPFMQSGSPQFITVHDGFKVLKLRYQMAQAQGYAKQVPSDCKKRKQVSSDLQEHTQFSMCIFLPDARDGLPDLVDRIASQQGFLHEHLPRKKVDVNEFRLPKFKLSFESSIVTILQKLGLELPFGDEADLSQMVERVESGMPLAVSDVIHKAVIEVNEEGTEAAAFTMAEVVFLCSVEPPSPPARVDFVADHPFAYFVVEEATGAVVFAGHVLNPSRKN